jgi:phosphosulfolactate synthase
MATSSTLVLPERTAKPRIRGLTLVIDNGVPARYFRDAIECAVRHIDLVKFGWGTPLVSDALEAKLACLRELHIDYFFGGTLFEKYVHQRQVDAYYDYCKLHRCRFVEISNGTIALANPDKDRFITEFAREFEVVSEVGYKDTERSRHLRPAKWIEYIRADLEAGASYAVTEARESGTSGICLANGDVRCGLIEEILGCGIDHNRIIFEAPNKALQTYFIRRLGANVNLGNIALGDVIAAETLRLGLRSDTLLAFERWPDSPAHDGEYLLMQDDDGAPLE